MARRRRQRVGFILGRTLRKREQARNGSLHLGLVGSPVADHGLLDRSWSVLVQRHFGCGGRGHCYAAQMSFDSTRASRKLPAKMAGDSFCILLTVIEIFSSFNNSSTCQIDS